MLAKHLQDRLVAEIRRALLSGSKFPLTVISDSGIVHKVSVGKFANGYCVGGQDVDGQFYRFYLVRRAKGFSC
jgi:hypothetical protein